MQRVAVWGTGNMGATAIRSTVAFPGLTLAGVITSSPGKVGTDAAAFAGLPAATGISATTDVDATLAACDAVAYMASGDTRPDEALADIERCLGAGVHVGRAPRVPSGSRSSAPPAAASASSSTTSPASTRRARRTGRSPTRASATTASSSTAIRS
jgi:2,4-diaminopentanoate dehydrogenase